jgi:hypothetical protein
MMIGKSGIGTAVPVGSIIAPDKQSIARSAYTSCAETTTENGAPTLRLLLHKGKWMGGDKKIPLAVGVQSGNVSFPVTPFHLRPPEVAATKTFVCWFAILGLMLGNGLPAA